MATRAVVTKASEEQSARYIKGICIDCGVKPYSAGRPRCDECHGKHAKWVK